MTIGLLSNEHLPRGLNWTLLSDSLYSAMSKVANCRRLAPSPLSIKAASTYFDLAMQAGKTTAVFSMKGQAKPEWPLQLLSWAARDAVRAVFYVDPWKHSIEKTIKADKLFGTDLAFVPYIEALRDLQARPTRTKYVYLPFACDTSVFRDFGYERDIDILWMGRRNEELHQAILKLSSARNLNYQYRETMGFIEDPRDLGEIAARSRYFVVTPPEADRSGGYSPLLMRYFEGLAAGCRLIGTMPGSGEYQTHLPAESLLQVAEDGSDLVSQYDLDHASETGWSASAKAKEIVHAEHGWDARARTIVEMISAFAESQKTG